MNLHPRVIIIVNKLLTNMNDRSGFKNSEKSNTLTRTTFLDPRFKNIPFNHNSTLLDTIKLNVIEKTSQIIRSKNTDLALESNQLSVQENDKHSYYKELSIWNDIDISISKVTPIGTAKSRAIVEVQRYLEDSIIPRSQDPLKWWKDHAYNYPPFECSC